MPKNRFKELGKIDIDSEVKEELIKKERISPIKKSKKTTKNTSISIDKDNLELMKIYCQIKNITFSDIVNNYLEEKFIPENKVKKVIQNYLKNL